MSRKRLKYKNQGSLFAEENSPEITLEAEVRELAREYFNVPSIPDAELPLLKAKRRLKAQAAGVDKRGMIAKWANYETAKGYVSIFDPVEGEWHDVLYKDAPNWAKWEAQRRTELYRAGDRRAFERTSQEMQEIWHREHPVEEDYIVEEHPIEEEEEE